MHPALTTTRISFGASAQSHFFWRLLFICMFIVNSSFSQNQDLIIDYSVRTNKENKILSTELEYKLVVSSQESYYWNTIESPRQYIYGPHDAKTEKVGDFIMMPLNSNTMGRIIQDKFYKDYSTNKLVYNEIQGSKLIVINESIDIFEWAIVPQKDTVIMSVKCQMAKTKFRGRVYEAFFSPSLHAKGGPWKFDGLPGVILAVRSTDDYFRIVPIKITSGVPNNREIINPYKDVTDQITWDQFCKSEHERLKKFLKFMKSKGEIGDSGSIKVSDRIEDIGFKELTY